MILDVTPFDAITAVVAVQIEVAGAVQLEPSSAWRWERQVSLEEGGAGW